MLESGLYIVATPIGNLADITYRAVEVLQKVDKIAAENPRHSARLLTHYAVSTPVYPLHEHNEEKVIERFCDLLKSGESIALISDAGTPLISDPGFRLVRGARQLEIPVFPIPGPSAVITALSAAGLPTDRFSFEGFIPEKSTQRLKFFKNLEKEPRTMVFYESPHRVLKSLKHLKTVFGEARELVVARELTKQFERFYTGSIESVLKEIKTSANHQKGEFVFILAGCQSKIVSQSEEILLSYSLNQLLTVLLSKLSLKQAVQLAQELTEIKKNTIYNLAIQLQNKKQ